MAHTKRGACKGHHPLCLARWDRELTQGVLAHAASVSRRYLQVLEQDAGVSPTLRVARQIVDALNLFESNAGDEALTVDDLFPPQRSR